MQQGEIKATAFNQQAEDYVNLLQLNKVITISLKNKLNFIIFTTNNFLN